MCVCIYIYVPHIRIPKFIKQLTNLKGKIRQQHNNKRDFNIALELLGRPSIRQTVSKETLALNDKLEHKRPFKLVQNIPFKKQQNTQSSQCTWKILRDKSYY